ncbi:hypothetical protein lerEdw1_003597 [Lerista edwardsae]|nr:hypothetical protein lerEdw1_003597 [Lerista edwardsae]
MIFEMAMDATDSVAFDCKGDQRCIARTEADYPLRVLYCGGKCWGWGLLIANRDSSPKQESGIGEGQGTTGEEEEKKKQKRGKIKTTDYFQAGCAYLCVFLFCLPGGRGQIKQKKKTVPQKVTIAKIPRAKKKYVTRVCGLATFGIDLKEAQRFFAQKFSCGASVTGEDEIIIQGDFTDDIIEVIQEKWSEVDDESIEDLGEVKK